MLVRPAELATDTATTEDVVRHAMQACDPLDAIMLLEPSSPFVRPQTYDLAIDVMVQLGYDFLFGQVLYLFQWDWLKTRTDVYDQLTERTYYFDMDTSESVDIDTPHDLEHAIWLAANDYVDLSWAK